MAKRIERFEDFIAWQKARKLTADIYRVTSEGSFARDFGLKDQIRRAAVSSMSNLAEGFELAFGLLNRRQLDHAVARAVDLPDRDHRPVGPKMGRSCLCGGDGAVRVGDVAELSHGCARTNRRAAGSREAACEQNAPAQPLAHPGHNLSHRHAFCKCE